MKDDPEAVTEGRHFGPPGCLCFYLFVKKSQSPLCPLAKKYEDMQKEDKDK
jgi:hypothetical protein